MKKGSKLLCAFLGVAFLATGCATVGNVNNTEKEIIYNGNAAVCVSDYIYFGNSLSDYTSFSNDGSYNDAAKVSYLNRLENAVKLSATSNYYSPKNTEKVNDEVVGQANNFMFALGDYIYFSIPKREQEKDENGIPQYVYSHSTLVRSKLNGDAKSEMYKTSNQISNIEAVKVDGKYYIVFLDGAKLVKIEIGNNYKVSTIATEVSQMGVAKTYQKKNLQSTLAWNGYVVYTKAKKREDNNDVSGTTVYKTSLSTGKTKEIGSSNSTISIVGRERDVIYYTVGNASYQFDTNTTGTVDLTSNEYKIYDATFSDVKLIASQNKVYGKIFISNSKTIYMTESGRTGVLYFEANGETVSGSIINVNGTELLLATSTNIYRADITNIFSTTTDKAQTVVCSTVVTMASIKTDLVSYDGKYVYFYAQLEDEQEDEKISESDANYYLYRADVYRQDDFALLSLTKTGKRHS